MPAALLIVAPRATAEALAAGLRGTAHTIRIATTAAEVLAPAPAAPRPSVALVAATLPDSGGLPVILSLSRRTPPVPAILLSHLESPLQASLARAYGASGVVSECAGLPEVAEAVRCVADGWTWYFGELWRPDLGEPGSRVPLTRRQLEILDRVRRSPGRKAVASELGMAVYTLDEHLAVLRRRLNADSLPDLARRAAGLGLVGSH